MPISILMPALSPTMTEGKLSKWHKSEGDMVEAGDVIAEIETDKATMEVEAVDEGKIARILIAEGTDNVAVNDMIAVLIEEDEGDSNIDGFINDQQGGASNAQASDASATRDEQDSKEQEPAQKTKTASNQNQGEGAQVAQTVQTAQTASQGERIFASPLARRMASDQGIDLTQISGSGPRGRIVRADIEQMGKTGVSSGARSSTATATPSVATGGQRGGNVTALPGAMGPNARELADMLDIPYHLEENTNMRKTIAKRLLESKQTVPHYYLSVDCELDKLLAARKEINDGADGAFKLSVNDFILKACAIALKQVPEANVSWTDEAMVVYDRADVSVAVATPGGLITPIVKDADQKSLRHISEEVKDLATRARDGQLKPEEYQGGTFSLSNLGMYGIKSFNAIINPPQACILAVGAGDQRPVVKDGQIVPATVMTATASLDHRAIDGAVGAQFLSAFKTLIENPLTVLA